VDLPAGFFGHLAGADHRQRERHALGQAGEAITSTSFVAGLNSWVFNGDITTGRR
jgi:hypothetical protein